MADESSIAYEAALPRPLGSGLRIPRALSPRRALVRRFPPREIISFGAVGLICTLLFVLAYHFARAWLPPLAANGIALTSTAGLNFAANRWFTFPGRGGGLLSQAAQYFVFYAVGLGASSLALSSFLLLWPQPPQGAELTAVLLSGGLATAIRYVAMTLWVFRPSEAGTMSRPLSFLKAR